MQYGILLESTSLLKTYHQHGILQWGTASISTALPIGIKTYAAKLNWLTLASLWLTLDLSMQASSRTWVIQSLESLGCPWTTSKLTKTQTRVPTVSTSSNRTGIKGHPLVSTISLASLISSIADLGAWTHKTQGFLAKGAVADSVSNSTACEHTSLLQIGMFAYVQPSRLLSFRFNFEIGLLCNILHPHSVPKVKYANSNPPKGTRIETASITLRTLTLLPFQTSPPQLSVNRSPLSFRFLASNCLAATA